jgi:3-deoxy-D-manno-octulosonic-acid transferase
VNLPPEARRALRIYNLCFPLVFLALLPGFLLRMWRRGGWREKIGQRLGRYSAADRTRLAGRRWLWLQSISVGETLVALKLARALHERDPHLGIVLSVTTTTGFAEAGKAAGDWLEPIYNPIDAAWIVRRALETVRPVQMVFIEGEVWPNLTAECVRRGIPVTLVNARLSPRSEKRFRKFRALTGPIFRLLDRIGVPEPDDLPRWASLGYPKEKITVTGSIKFDNPAPGVSREAEFRDLLKPYGITSQTPIIVAGSTWAPEEKALATALIELRHEFSDLILILAPRHVERTAAIIRELAPFSPHILRRSELGSHSAQPADRPPPILILDTTGELRDWYALATVVFIGKSLPGITEVGGQNPAEPAALGRPVITGPHMENFAALVAHLRTHEALCEIPDARALAPTLRTLLADPATRTRLGTRAQAALALHAGSTARTSAMLLP